MSVADADVAVGRWCGAFAEHGIFTTDDRLVITSWNRWLERHSGRAAADLVGRPLLEAYPELTARGLDEHYRNALAGQAYLASHLLHGHLLSMRTHTGEHLFATMRQRARIAPLLDRDRVVGTITVIDDVSERAASEHELRTQIAALQAARAEAEDALRGKDEFLAMLGHELRNPLAPILTALELLKLRGVEAGAREHDVIERQVRHLAALVNDLLDVSRITRGKVVLRKAPVEIAAVVARAVEIASPLLEQRRHVLEIDVPPSGLLVDGDAGRLAQAVSNLLANAAKYTEPNGSVSVVGRAVADDVLVQVRDTGSGIDPEMLPQVFDLFVQERQTLERTQGGLGLGLAIVRNLVALHGGSVTASSAGKGRGAEFSIRLPRLTAVPTSRERQDDRRPVAGTSPGTAGWRVLIVDDNADAATLLADMLSLAGFTARHAQDGPSALRAAEELAPDVAMLDIGLPVMDGYELAHRFATHPRLGRTRLVALTGYGQEQDRRRAAAAGFVAHLVKPVALPELLALLETLSARDLPRGCRTRGSSDTRGGVSRQSRPNAEAGDQAP